MSETPEAIERVLFDSEDPRLKSEHVKYRPYSDEEGYLVVVGVVHDHPASIFRVGRVVELLQPDFVAVELPQLAIPLFESFADAGTDTKNLGGEMSIALEKAGDAERVGIDAPSLLYTRRLISRLSTGEVPPRLIWRVFKDLLLAYAQAFWIMIAALVCLLTGLRLRAHTPIEHDITKAATPSEQAIAESEHIAQRRAFVQAIEIPKATQMIDTVRERVMAERLRSLRREGDVVAVVGQEHLDPILERIDRARVGCE